MMHEKIQGRSLLGFASEFETNSFLGGPGKPPPGGKPNKPPPPKPNPPKGGGGKPTPGKISVQRTKTVENSGKVLSAARATAAKAVKAAAGALKAAARRATKPLKVQVGAAAKMTEKQRQAVDRHRRAQAKSAQLAKAAAAAGQRAKKAVIDLAKKSKAQKLVAVTLRKGKGGSTRLRGIEIGGVEIGTLDEYYTLIGAEPDPNNPGFLTDGSPDPAAGGAEDPIDVSDLFKEEPITLPPPPPMDTFIADMELNGGIPYDGSKGTPDGFVGSYGLMMRTTDRDSGVPKTAGIDPVFHYGYVFGRYHDVGPERGIPFGDNLQSGAWNHVHGRYILGGFRSGAGSLSKDGAHVVEPQEAYGSSTHYANNVAYGPLIGNPHMKDFVGMRVDAKGRMFWLPQEAPDWLTFPLKQAAALTAQAEQKAAAAAAKAEAARIAKEQADAAESQARQDAANALAESQAASEQKITQAQQETQAQQVELQQVQLEQQGQQQDMQEAAEARQILAQQAQMEMEQQRATYEQQRQTQQMLLEQARREQEYLAKHPEVEFAPQRGADEGSGEEFDEEGPPVDGYDEQGSEDLSFDGAGEEVW